MADVKPKAKAPRKARADSKESAVAAMIAEKVTTIEPPEEMEFSDTQMRIFNEVIDEFAKIDWTPHQVRIAAILSRTLASLSEAQEQLNDEGFTADSARGTPVVNPLVSVTNQLSGQVMSLRRTLALHASAGQNKVDVDKRRSINKANAADAPDDEDDLIAMPSNVARLRA